MMSNIGISSITCRAEDGDQQVEQKYSHNDLVGHQQPHTGVVGPRRPVAAAGKTQHFEIETTQHCFEQC